VFLKSKRGAIYSYCLEAKRGGSRKWADNKWQSKRRSGGSTTIKRKRKISYETVSVDKAFLLELNANFKNHTTMSTHSIDNIENIQFNPTITKSATFPWYFTKTLPFHVYFQIYATCKMAFNYSTTILLGYRCSLPFFWITG